MLAILATLSTVLTLYATERSFVVLEGRGLDDRARIIAVDVRVEDLTDEQAMGIDQGLHRELARSLVPLVRVAFERRFLKAAFDPRALRVVIELNVTARNLTIAPESTDWVSSKPFRLTMKGEVRAHVLGGSSTPALPIGLIAARTKSIPRFQSVSFETLAEGSLTEDAAVNGRRLVALFEASCPALLAL